MKRRQEADVIVVGAGPVGLFAALCLADQRVEVQILDKDWIGSAHSYALSLHPSSLAMLDRLGLAEELVESGHRIDRVGFYDREACRARLSLGELDAKFPFVLVVPQSKLEQLIEQTLQKRKVKVLWNHQALSLEQREETVLAELGRMDRVSLGYPVARSEWVIDKRFETGASYAIGADGYHSFTRHALNLKYEDVGEAQSFAVFEFQTEADNDGEMRVVFHQGTTNVLWPMKDGKARWSFQIAAEPGGEQEPPDIDTLIRERAPWFRPASKEVYWSTITRFERRLTGHFGRGRIWLAGDAAHITGPVGTQSMNVGLREASDLADRLAVIINQGGSTQLLTTYNEERVAEWRMLLGLSRRLRPSDGVSEWIRENASGILPCVPASGEHLTQLLRQIGLEFE